MAVTVPTSFITLYASEVKAAYQREGSYLRQAVRVREGVGAERVYFPILGKGIATPKGRHADVVPMNIEHSKVYADLTDYYAPEYIDELDQVKVNWSLRSEYVRASAWALGRQTDEIIVSALSAATQEVSTSGTSASGSPKPLVLADVLSISKTLNEKDVPLDRQRWAVISPAILSDLLNIPGVTSSDFAREQILVTGAAPAFWMGFNWIVYSGFPAYAANTIQGYFFHTSAAGLAIGRDIQTSIDWIPTKVAWLVNSWISMGAVAVDPTGIVKLKVGATT